MTMLIPYRAVDPVADQLGADAYDDDGDDDRRLGERMHRAMRGVDVQLRAEVAAVPLAAEDVLGLQVRRRPALRPRRRRPA